MVKIRKYANGIERFLHGEKGQRFFNFAYSIGAAIVIWGALFKILHLPGGSLLLCIGMGTEIAMFILTAFDRPPKEYAWEEVFPVLDSRNEEDRPDFHGGLVASALNAEDVEPSDKISKPSDASTVVVGEDLIPNYAEPSQLPNLKTFSSATEEYAAKMEELSDKMAELNESYATRMADLNHNVSGLNTIYEVQLKSICSQLETLESVNRGLKDIRDMYEKSANQSARYCEETEKMARYMRQLNAVYEKMITAMTINMQNPMMGNMGGNPFEFESEGKTED